MNQNSQNDPIDERDTGEPLPADLQAAVDGVRRRAAPGEMVARVRDRAKRSQTDDFVEPSRSLIVKRLLVWGLATAAAILCGVTVHLAWPVRVQPDRSAQGFAPVEITRTSFVALVRAQLESDLSEAEQRLDETTESLEWVALRREIEATLEQYHNWRDEP